MNSEIMYSTSPNDPATDSRIVSDAVDLRHALHRIPEPSCKEKETAALLKRFLTERTRCAVLEDGETTSFCALLDTGLPGPTIAFRADMDGVPVRESTDLPYRSRNDGYSHACGHDGHAAILAGFMAAASALLDGRTIAEGVRNKAARGGRIKYAEGVRNKAATGGRLLALFQKGEETGAGAREIVERNLFGIRGVDRILGLHNIPGFPLGRILIRDGVFAYASQGLEISLIGSTSHAAYPEFGRNPARALSDLVFYISSAFRGPVEPGILSGYGPDPSASGIQAARASGAPDPNASGGIDSPAGNGFVTIVGLNAGTEGVPSFGTSAGEGSLQCTIRGESEAAVLGMERAIRLFAENRAKVYGLRAACRVVEPFPETRNHPSCLAVVRSICASCTPDPRVSGTTHPHRDLPLCHELAEPMRWSEDFGHYTRVIPGAFFGLGAGEGHPELHTSGYDFPDALVPIGIRIFAAIAELLLAG